MAGSPPNGWRRSLGCPYFQKPTVWVVSTEEEKGERGKP